jgi:hypothetical protein
MGRYQITCGTLGPAGHPDGHQHVATVGYTDNGRKMLKARAEMVDLLDTPGNTAFTGGGGVEAEVLPVDCHCGVRVLRSHADTTTRDNLHGLPSC